MMRGLVKGEASVGDFPRMRMLQHLLIEQEYESGY